MRNSKVSANAILPTLFNTNSFPHIIIIIYYLYIGKIYVYFVRIAFFNNDPRPILLFFLPKYLNIKIY